MSNKLIDKEPYWEILFGDDVSLQHISTPYQH